MPKGTEVSWLSITQQRIATPPVSLPIASRSLTNFEAQVVRFLDIHENLPSNEHSRKNYFSGAMCRHAAFETDSTAVLEWLHACSWTWYD